MLRKVVGKKKKSHYIFCGIYQMFRKSLISRAGAPKGKE